SGSRRLRSRRTTERMDFLGKGLGQAIDLLLSGDPLVYDAAGKSLAVSAAAVALAALFGIPLGAVLARVAFPGRTLVVALARAGMSIPTVLIGLLGWGILSRRGPLGAWELLYTPTAIVAGEFFLSLPIIMTWTHEAIRKLDHRVFETATTLGLPFTSRWRLYLAETRVAISLAMLTAFARCFTELGIAMMLGGNIKERTRTLATATALETSRGEFERGLAMSLILVAMGLVITLGLGLLNAPQRSESR
ncbi:MAG: ABC transporter permease, partial [Planctomycetes bacterium]|nr:ABC transporter permease [Planctomycetota bacterium]